MAVQEVFARLNAGACFVRRAGAWLVVGWLAPFLIASPPAGPPKAELRPRHVSGRVVFLQAEAAKVAQVEIVDSAAESVLGIVTTSGERIPLFENERVNAFRVDKRLRNIPLELVIVQDPRVPFAQLLRIFEWRDGKRMEVLYWCEVCAIAAARPGPCACCQADVELRRIPAPVSGNGQAEHHPSRQ